MTEYLKIRPYLSEDYYPLTEPSVSLDVWCASQYNRPSMGDGIIQIFCRENVPYDRAVFKLRGLKGDKIYIFTDIDDDSSFALNGKELLEKVLHIEISEKRKDKIYMYKEV